MIKVKVHQRPSTRHAVVVALDRMKLHIQQSRRVVGPLHKRAQPHKVQCFIFEHGAQRHAAPQVRAVLDPLKKLRRVLLPGILRVIALQRQPGLVLCLPRLRRQCTAHGTSVFSRSFQASEDGRRIGLIRHHELQHGFTIHHGILGLECRYQFADGQHALPAAMRIMNGLRQHGSFIGHAEHARGVLCPLGIAGHPVQMVCGT